MNDMPIPPPQPENALQPLVVFDRLEAGPPRLEKDRVTMPYRLFIGDREETADFVYRFEEPVFEPDDPASRNLAAMMGAQIALNYGLFCRTIAFLGIYDETDRRFLRDMMENTSREIYVKKFLEPNPFLTGAAANLNAVKRKQYTQAVLEFPDSADRTQWMLWPGSRDRYAVLSSGGKDSLLTFGILNELQADVHPIYVNESGRHWFTALNAYRHFRERVPSTARVWVNSDRMFAFFLRHMPFIRPDFAQVRSDEYPIRLWTVAVFLFGTLPLVRKRGIGRVLIGDEFDTTDRTQFQGITHYNGLFDQSRFFDQTLSRYFMRKGWNISQFSLLRPLSELLIEKVLAERYPDLQAHQVSCHAAHAEGERIHPCGRCEKCRRIVGMLSALGKDPGHCGYSPEQIRTCMNDLARKPVHQESAGAEQMMVMLTDRGILPTVPGAARFRPHPEVLQLRFDNEHSPVDAIPLDLRKPVWDIFLKHATGSVRRAGRRWEPFDCLNDPAGEAPYAFDITGDRRHLRPPLSAEVSLQPSYLWGELTWPDAGDALRRVDIALLPVGSIEQHGPHLPLDTDAFDADYLARRIAEACSDPKPLVLPLIPYGASYEHDAFRGTVSISNHVLSELVYEIGMSVAKNGINKLVIINGHGGNTPALNFAAQKITRDARIFVCVDTGHTSDVDIDSITETPNDVHAGEVETSTSLAVRPHLVRMDRAVKFIPRFSSRYLNFSSKRGVSWFAYTQKISKDGVLGDPTRAGAEKGEKIWRIMIAHLVALVEDLKGLTLEEIYQRRY